MLKQNDSKLGPDNVKILAPLHNKQLSLPGKAASKQAPKTLDFGRLGSEYAVHREVARGGYGVVYFATSFKSNAPFAIKVFLPHHRQLHALQEVLYMQFLQEYPYFAKIRDVEITNTNVLLVMDWVHTSVSYGDILENGPIERVLKYMVAICKAVETLHDHNVVHHDIKPSNFVYDPVSDQGVLLDFGTMMMVAF